MEVEKAFFASFVRYLKWIYNLLMSAVFFLVLFREAPGDNEFWFDDSRVDDQMEFSRWP